MSNNGIESDDAVEDAALPAPLVILAGVDDALCVDELCVIDDVGDIDRAAARVTA